MTTNIYFPAVDPTFSTVVSKKPRVISNAYGDGYTQDIVDGLNAQPESWAVMFENVPLADYETVDTFLTNQMGVLPFNWTPPDRGMNQLVNSERLDLWSGYTGLLGTPTPNVINGPLGGLPSASQLQEDTSTGYHNIYQDLPAVNPNDSWWLSVYAKSITRTAVHLHMYGESQYPVFDLSAGVVSSPAGLTCNIYNAGGGWYRIAAQFIKTNTNPRAYFGLYAGATSYAGAAGDGVYLWGAQADLYATYRPYRKNGALLNANQFKCKAWTAEKMSAASGTVKATFTQDFTL